MHPSKSIACKGVDIDNTYPPLSEASYGLPVKLLINLSTHFFDDESF